jgi:chromosome partitioning protein
VGKIIAITNQKGGVGKTTTAVNFAAALSEAYHVLLIDLDPQGNATMGSGVDKHTLSLSINDVLLNDAKVREVILSTSADFKLLPANSDLTVAEVYLLKHDNSQSVLREKLKTISAEYDYIIIDCPPSLNMLTVNALVAANAVIVPIQCEYYALEGLSALVDTLDQIKQDLNPGLAIDGLLRTMYDGRSKLCQDVSDELETHFKDRLFNTVIPRNTRLAEAPSYGLPVMLYDKRAKGSSAYVALAGEFLRREMDAKTGSSNAAPTADTLEIVNE